MSNGLSHHAHTLDYSAAEFRFRPMQKDRLAWPKVVIVAMLVGDAAGVGFVTKQYFLLASEPQFEFVAVVESSRSYGFDDDGYLDVGW